MLGSIKRMGKDGVVERFKALTEFTSADYDEIGRAQMGLSKAQSDSDRAKAIKRSLA